jgi:hypothetical protein
VLAAPLVAQDNMDKLTNMQRIEAQFTFVEQEGQRAEALKDIIQYINVPDGFEVSLYAIVPDARSMAVAPQGTVVFVGTPEAQGLVGGRSGPRPCRRPGEGLLEEPDPALGVVVAQGELIPPEEESFNHTARVCRVGPDGKLHISLGQPYNVQPVEKLEMYDEAGIGGIIRINTDGSGREVFTRGVRNSVGHDFNPENGDLWFTDNQVDGMGDEIPPGELNRQTEAGQHFGFPWTNASVEIPEFEDVERPEGVEFVEPQVEMDAHAADLGMSFYRHSSFPEKYHGGIFSAQHGSWNRTTPIGARVMFTSLDEEGNAAGTEVFADGWLNEDTGEYRGRPMDIAFLPDGSILVSDDFAGAIWRIAYNPPPPAE